MATFEGLITNPGFHYVAEQIFITLDPQSLATCKLLSKAFRDFTDDFIKSLTISKIKEVIESLKPPIKKYKSNKQVNVQSKTSIEDFCKFIRKEFDATELLILHEFMKNQWSIPATYPIEIFDDLKMSIIQLACDRNNAKVLKAFLDKGTNIDFVDIEGNTPMHYACLWDYIEIVELLLTHEAYIFYLNVENIEGWTPLGIACANGHLNIVKEIVNYSIEKDQVEDLFKIMKHHPNEHKFFQNINVIFENDHKQELLKNIDLEEFCGKCRNQILPIHTVSNQLLSRLTERFKFRKRLVNRFIKRLINR